MAIVDPAKSKESFLELYDKYVLREGFADLRNWLLQSDFFTAPASTRYHGCYEGGLCTHSVSVWKNVVKLLKAYSEIKTYGETVAIISLLHDVCKINLYKTDYKNVKNESGAWEKVPYYVHDEKLSYGNHGAKSVYLINKHIILTDEEAVSIQCHMGNEDGKYSTADSYRQFPLAWILHVADEAATYIDEKE